MVKWFDTIREWLWQIGKYDADEKFDGGVPLTHLSFENGIVVEMLIFWYLDACWTYNKNSSNKSIPSQIL